MARVTGWVMLVAILLAPATRVGYLLYPIDLFLWAWMFRRSSDPTGRARITGRGRRRRGSVAVGGLQHLDRVRGDTGGVVGETTTPVSQ